MKWLKDNRETMVPWVEDFNDPQDHIRYCQNVNMLSYNEWFWCHPSSFKLVHYGAPGVSLVLFGALGAIGAVYGSFYLVGIMLVLMIIIGSDLFKKLKNTQITKNTTMYDMYLRDY
jgi:hypothetical protein